MSATDAFNHVVRVDTLSEIKAAIRRPEINLTYTSLPISPVGQDYVDNLILGNHGDFSHLQLFRPIEDISPHRYIAILEFHDKQELEPDVLLSRMMNLPDREGRLDFVVSISGSLKTFWDTQNEAQPIKAILMEKQPHETPHVHFDGMEDGRTMRGLVTFKGKPTNYLANDDTHLIAGGDSGFEIYMDVLEEFKKRAEVRELPVGAFSLHKGLLYKTVPRLSIDETGKVTYTALVADPMIYQNPLAHCEASAQQCAGQPRLQLMIDQVPPITVPTLS